MIFLGTQPTLTQVPPSFFSSITAALAPCSPARFMVAIPPLPPPIAMISYSLIENSFVLFEIVECHFLIVIFYLFFDVIAKICYVQKNLKKRLAKKKNKVYYITSTMIVK